MVPYCSCCLCLYFGSSIMLVTYFVNFRYLNDHLFGKELFILFAASAFSKLSSIYVFSYFPFGFEGRIWDLIVSVPDHCLSFYFPLSIQMFIKVTSSPRLSGIGMPSPILWSHPLKMQRIVLLSSLLWWELGTNSLITGPGEWLSFRRFTGKLSWSWTKNTLLCIISLLVRIFIIKCWQNCKMLLSTVCFRDRDPAPPRSYL